MSTKPIFTLLALAALALGLTLLIAPAYASGFNGRCGTLNCGDLNADGQIGASDILACMREASLIGTENCRLYCAGHLDFPLIETCADAPSRVRVPFSAAGMTRVSLNTSASPGASKPGRSVITLSASGSAASGPTTSSRAASRGCTGLSAISSSGR